MSLFSIIQNFFFADGYRIAILIMLTIAFVLNLLIFRFVFSSKQKFSITFIVMLNIIFCGFMSGFGYVFNWVIFDYSDNEEKTYLLFGNSKNFLCQFQSFLIGFFQESRETLVTLIPFIILIKSFDTLSFRSTPKNIAILLSIGYCPPLFMSLFFLFSKAYGQSDRFCFIDKDADNYGKIHTIYICIIILISISLVAILIIHLCIRQNKERKNSGSDSDFNDEEYQKVEKKTFSFSSPLCKLLLFPLAQLIFMAMPIFYRFKTFIINPNIEASHIGGIAAIMNTFPSFIYTFIFAFNSNAFSLIRKSIVNEKIEVNDSRELINNASDDEPND